MNIGSLEYVVIGVPDDPFTQVILPELHAPQGAGHLSSNGAIASGCRRRWDAIRWCVRAVGGHVVVADLASAV